MNFPHTQYLCIHIPSTSVGLLSRLHSSLCWGNELTDISQDIYNSDHYNWSRQENRR